MMSAHSRKYAFVSATRRFSVTARKSAEVKHIVMFRFRADATEEQKSSIQQGLLALPEKLSQIKTYELGVDLALPSGQNHPSGPNRQLSWTASFASVDDYLEYNDSQAHMDFLAELKNVAEPGSRAAIQYELHEDESR